MNKIFISHSSQQKDIVIRLADVIGQDRCIVDCYDFRASERLEDEIKRRISQASFFCLLISETALTSDWVTAEVHYVREMVETNKILFRAFIIDPTINPTDTRISPWIKNYLLHAIPSAKIIGRVLSDDLREVDYSSYPLLKLRDSLFIGRGKPMSDLETEHVLKSRIKAIIISGIPHIGRHRFALQYLRKISGDEKANFCVISLERGRSIEDLALYINDFVEAYSPEEILNILVSEHISKKKECIISLINKLYYYHQYLLIYDDFCLIQRNGYIVDWFKDILKSPLLQGHAGLYILSKVGVNFGEVEQLPMVQQALLPLEERDIHAIIKAYSVNQGLHIEDNDIKTISLSVKGFPGYVYPIVDAWVKKNRYVAFEKMRDLEKSIADVLEYIVEILNEHSNNLKTQLLLLLAHFELISIRLLNELFDNENLDEMLGELQELSILEYLGYSREYIRIHPVVADFLKRSKSVKLSREFIARISARASEVVKAVEAPESDIATYMYGIKQILKNGLSTEKDVSRYMIPSLALNVIVEEYEDKNYKGVLTLCERMLSGSKNYEDHIEWGIRYWQCLALCRMKDTKLFDAVEYFEGRYTYHFLLGFYNRIQELWSKAEAEYELALKMSGNSTDNNKIKQELVLVRIKQGDYHGALSLAEENYKRQRFNSFFIEAYFRCLVKNPYADPEILKSLISDMEKSQGKSHRDIADTMNAEYSYYFEGDFWKASGLLQNVIERHPELQYPKEVYASICKEADKPQLFREFMKKNGGK